MTHFGNVHLISSDELVVKTGQFMSSLLTLSPYELCVSRLANWLGVCINVSCSRICHDTKINELSILKGERASCIQNNLCCDLLGCFDEHMCDFTSLQSRLACDNQSNRYRDLESAQA